jgi:hypothetical protein
MVCAIIGYLICCRFWGDILLLRKISRSKVYRNHNIVLGNVLGGVFFPDFISFLFILAFSEHKGVGEFVGGYLLPVTPWPGCCYNVCTFYLSWGGC